MVGPLESGSPLTAPACTASSRKTGSSKRPETRYIFSGIIRNHELTWMVSVRPVLSRQENLLGMSHFKGGYMGVHVNGCNWQLVTSLICRDLQRTFVSSFRFGR